MQKYLMPLLLLLFLVTAIAEQTSGAYLVLAFSRGPSIARYYDAPMTHSAVTIPIASMERCQEEGN